jgi:20S proteasome subunit alpha 3
LWQFIGRLLQIEYAIERINKEKNTVGIMTSEGVVLGTQREEKKKLQDGTHDHMHKIDDHLFVSVSGIAADADSLIDDARVFAQKFTYQYGKHIPIEQLVKMVCSEKHYYTLYGSYRPLGVHFMYAGWDHLNGYQLYSSDPSGNYYAWKAHATGENNATLKSEYEENMTLRNGLKLAAKVIYKSIDAHDPKTDRFEIKYVSQIESKLVIKTIDDALLTELLEEIKKEIEDEKDKKK